jgi:hypothetical protein
VAWRPPAGSRGGDDAQSTGFHDRRGRA